MKKLLLIISCVLFSGIFFFSPVKAESPTPAPTFPAFPTLTIPDPVPACYVGGITGSHDETIYPPNSACYAEVKRTQSKIKDYTKTCIKEPIVTYEDIRGVDGYGNSYQECFGVDGFPCDIYITVETDISKAELGSYGPSYDTLLTSSTSADLIAKKYLFNSLFDRPYFSTEDTPREAWRTYWRLLPFNEQANLTAQFINLVLLPNYLDNDTLKRINNTKYQYINSKGKIKEITVKKLAGLLPKCLKTEPVCADYISKYNNLNQETKDAYDSIIPLSFNNLRGFIALSPPSFPPRPAVIGTVSRESIPYIEPIFSGLLSSKYGLLANLQPDWLFTKSIDDLTDTNTGYDLTTGKDNYISGQFQGSFGDISLNPTVLDNADISSCPDLPDVYNISAPRTFPKNKFNDDPNHFQEIQILGSTLTWTLDHPDPSKKCILRNSSNRCIDWEYFCASPASVCGNNNNQCCQYIVTGSGTGKALTVFNNPKTTDIKQAVVGNQETSLYNTLIASAFITPTPVDKKIDAPTSTHINKTTEYSGSSSVSNPENPIIRENNLAQDIVHIIQNCWLVPSDQQSSSKCGLLQRPSGTCPGVADSAVDPKYLGSFKTNFINLANRWTQTCTGPENNLADECYDYVASEAKKAGVNPAFALTIWLNESGASNYCFSGPTTQDLGINLPDLYKNIVGQVEVFLKMAKERLCEGQSGFNEPMHGWLSRFQSHAGICDPTDPIATQYYFDVKDTTWSWLTGCSNASTFGITWPTDTSCP